MVTAILRLVEQPRPDRHEQISLSKQPKRLRHHADHGVAAGTQHQGAADDAVVASEALLPEAVRQHRDRLCAR